MHLENPNSQVEKPTIQISSDSKKLDLFHHWVPQLGGLEVQVKPGMEGNTGKSQGLLPGIYRDHLESPIPLQG